MPWDTRKKWLIFILLPLLFSFIFLLSLISLGPDKLSVTSRVNANILLVEGWLPGYAIQMAGNEFQNNGYDFIITTGLKDTRDYFNVFTNGWLVFKPSSNLLSDGILQNHSIKVKAYSSLGGANRAEFRVLVNGTEAGSFKAHRVSKYYNVEWHGLLSDIDSISVQFLNDRVGTFGDRNLFVREICIDEHTVIRYQLNSFFMFLNGGRRFYIKNDYESFADLARNSLISLGLDSTSVVSIPGEKVAHNRTLTSAVAVKRWISANNADIKGINIVSMGYHARRTWLTYNKVLQGTCNIGIISLPDYRAQNSPGYKIFKTLRETLGLIYYRIILVPY